MKYAMIEEGIIVNLIVADEEFASSIGVVGVPDHANIGDLYADGIVTPIERPPAVPAEITMRQARLVLLGAGLLDNVGPAIDALPSPQKEAAQIEWEYSNALQRTNPFVLMMAPALGLSSGQVDAMFIAAARL